MLLEWLFLTDFGCFENRAFEFTTGLNLIYGPNFAGKSTLISAIYFCLTGKPLTPGIAASDLARMGKASGAAELQFTVAREKYLLSRSTKGDAQLSLWQSDRWETISSLRHRDDHTLQHRLGIDPERLAATVFLREGEIAQFLTREPAERKKMLYALLGIDELLRVKDIFVEVRKESKREEKRLQGYKESLRPMQTANYKEEIDQLEREVLSLECQLEQLGRVAAATANGALLGELEWQRAKLLQEVESSTEEITRLLEPFGSRQRLEDEIQQLAERQKREAELESQHRSILSEVGKLAARLETLTQHRNLLAPLARDGASAICPLCEQPIDQATMARLLQEKEAEIARCQESLAKAREELEKCAALIDESRRLVARKQDLERKREMIIRLERQQALYEAGLAEIEARLAALSKSKQETETIVRVQRERNRLKNEIEAKRQRIVELKAKEAVLAQEAVERERVLAETEKAKRRRLRAELACDAVDRTITAMFSEIIRPIEVEVQRVLTEFSILNAAEVDIHTEHLLPVLRWTEGRRDLNSLSSSEKMILYFCIKVALGRALSHLGVFVFDDPMLHLDLERRQLMAKFIRTLANQHQVIVTSNDRALLGELTPENIILL